MAIRSWYTRHAPGCLVEQAWDIPEAQDHCTCSFPFPFRVCCECGNRPHQHARFCSLHPKYDPKKAEAILARAKAKWDREIEMEEEAHASGS